MDDLFNNKSFENATVFEFGYIAEPQQFEVRQIRFHIVSPKGQGEFEAATFVKRGKRNEKTVNVNQLVVIQGWGHPKLDINTTHTADGRAKFPFGSNSWNDLLDQHLASLVPPFQLIVDGRERPQLTRRLQRGSARMENQNLCEVVQDIPPGVVPRRWNQRADYRCAGGSHWHSRGVRLSESPLYLELNWHKTAADPVQRVGFFRLDLNGLLRNGYIRLDKPDRHGAACVRLRVFRADDGSFYVQTKQGKPKLFIAADLLTHKEAQQPPTDLPNSAIDDIPSAPAGSKVPGRTSTAGSRFQRDEKVRRFVTGQAKGACEYCRELGFLLPDGSHYLEAHHIIALANQGSDTVDNVIALCPSDHREAHYGKKAVAMENEMIEIIKKRNPPRGSGHKPPA